MPVHGADRGSRIIFILVFHVIYTEKETRVAAISGSEEKPQELRVSRHRIIND